MKKKLFIIVKILAAVVVVLALFQLIRIAVTKQRTEAAFDDLRRRYAQISNEAPLNKEESTINKAACVNEKLLKLHEQNSDCVGWLTIDGTNIDYPVMLSAETPEFYLDHDFNGDYDYHGVPFIDAHASPSADNITIYGHSMLDGTMFSELTRFTEKTFCEKGLEIRFDTLDAEGRYQVVSVFKIAEKDIANFPYHLLNEFSEDGVTAADYVARSKYYALWYDDVKLNSEDKMITLSTCEYSLDNGRLVIVARRV